ncbi:ComEA family DNA-binding protein [Shewanella violacea]|uniref:DNA-binding protein, putative n=1 Tax=Shewanella violacea (strain JCM 10179 / CIP 106290 / LMG 19151 / DSS12) TaxID=637905 RepID=D4ZAA4_SHEVD|nr:ComEA family DNA-binding protein [Shewanella violacea]BAJ02949.1 DNA-binding protein, putative [Shewanella violacea DSS12]
MKITQVSATLMAALFSLSVYAGEVSSQSKAPHKKVNINQVQQLNVNINTSSIEQLVLLKGIGESKAKAIVEYRESNGKFMAIGDLSKVKGIGAKLVDKNRLFLSL